jgi:hypothetical protein
VWLYDLFPFTRHYTTTVAKPRTEAKIQKNEPRCPVSKVDKNTIALIGIIW